MAPKDIIIWVASVALMVVFFLFLGSILYETDEPTSFTEAVKLLKKNKEIQAQIGSYSSHSWKHTELPEETDNPATFKVSFKGSEAEVYLTCRVSKDKKGVWKLDKILQDSIKQFEF